MISNTPATDIFIGTGVSSSKDYDGLLRIISTGIENGIRCFDTAPSYNTELLLGKVLKVCLDKYKLERKDVFIQTKIDAWQMQNSNGKIREYVIDALNKMQFDYFDSILIHWPIPEYFASTWESFCLLKEEGLSRNIGVCNVRIRHLEQFLKLGIIPEIIQLERHPLHTCEEETKFCDDNKIWLQAYSPLCKMHIRLIKSTSLNKLAEKHKKSIGQIILRWHLESGVTPIFASRKPERISEYADIFDFRLSDDDIRVISAHNENFKLYLESWACPGI